MHKFVDHFYKLHKYDDQNALGVEIFLAGLHAMIPESLFKAYNIICTYEKVINVKVILISINRQTKIITKTETSDIIALRDFPKLVSTETKLKL